MTPIPTHPAAIVEDPPAPFLDASNHPTNATAGGSQDPLADTDQVMDNAQDAGERDAPPEGQPTPPPRESGVPSSCFTIRIPSQRNYANALKHSADEIRDTEEGENEPQPSHDNDPLVATAPRWPQKPAPGPIKGFNATRIFENLDYQVKETWKVQAPEAVFVHYLDGGYNPTVAQNVHTIEEDLKGKHPNGTRPVSKLTVTLSHS